VQGAERSYAATLSNGELRIEKQDGAFTTLSSVPFQYEMGDRIELTLSMKGDRLFVKANGAELSASDGDGYKYGCVGWSVEKGRMKIETTSVATE
jgi:hypothetical protein